MSNNVIQPHLDQLTKGLIFRFIGGRKINALAISMDEIISITINKKADKVSPIAFTPFWFFTKLVASPRTVRWLTWGSTTEFEFGALTVSLRLKEGEISLEWYGKQYLEIQCFFTNQLLTSKI
ncbi:hypothetical protein FNH22_14805 [Fulvivirga sp. M361]|uniref:hypothetical protein n=1 Tax=Fulvivirga sp. M361 TaxID=2594266 RepID=UPI00117AA48E|nr:hypothetical protein [Fulvivirga sp. M361]TRX57679.1 hypothetical protein FNH22_14805 [Fulvivirga sp. M361]